MNKGNAPDASTCFQHALALYRGPAFEGLEDIDDLAIESRRFAELRLVAAEGRFAAELSIGGHAELVPELEALVAFYPLRERLRVQLMTALYRSGRKADALAAYRAGRDLLVAELGVEPNEECQALQHAILADDPALLGPSAETGSILIAAKPPRPQQLPADVTHFTGRNMQLQWLDELLAGLAAIVVVDGQPGVGKSALVTHWAHRSHDWFTDGQLYVNLRGHTIGAPRRSIDALSQLLRALGVSQDQLPSEVDEAAAQFRSLMAHKRILLLLDDAVDADQVRPLLPGTGGCLTIVTSRNQLPGLVAREGAHRLRLDVLPSDEAVALVTSFLGQQRVAAEPTASFELAQLCARLPLALRVAAASLAAHPSQRIADWVTRLRHGDGLAALTVPGDQNATITAALELSYVRLPSPAQRMFRLLGLAPSVEITARPAAQLAGITTAEAAQLLATLAATNLVEEPRTGRYTCHELLRRFAATLTQAQESDLDQSGATTRYYNYYLATANAAHNALYPHTLRLPDEPGLIRSIATSFGDAQEAYAWLEDERDTLITIISHTAQHGPRSAAWRLTDAVRSYLTLGPMAADVLLVAEAAEAAAAADAKPLAQVSAILTAIAFFHSQGRYRLMEEHADRAWQVVRDTDWVAGQGVVRNLLGIASNNQGRLHQAVDHYLAALTQFEQIDWLHGQAVVVHNLSAVLLDLGQLQRAVAHASKAVTVLAKLGSIASHGHTLIELGEACHLSGQLDHAFDHFTLARERCRAGGSRAGEAEAMRGLALVHADMGQLQLAQELAERSVTIIQSLGDQRLEPHCLATLAEVRQRRKDLAAAALCYRQAADLAAATGDRYLETLALVGLASLQPPPDGYELCRKCGEQALDNTRQYGFRLLEGQALAALAGIDLATGATRDAITWGEHALVRHRETGHRIGEARTRLLLGDAYQCDGDIATARKHWQHAHTIFTEIGACLEANNVATQLKLATDWPE